MGGLKRVENTNLVTNPIPIIIPDQIVNFLSLKVAIKIFKHTPINISINKISSLSGMYLKGISERKTLKNNDDCKTMCTK